MYNTYDANRKVGDIESNAGEEFDRYGGCPGGTYYKVLGTMDNHPGYDYGSPICGDYPAINGTRVNGMNMSGMGEVISVSADGLWIDQGVVRLINGELARIVLKFGHIAPLLNQGDYADYSTTIGLLEETCQEVEVQVLAADADKTRSLRGPELKHYLSEGDPTIDPKLIGLEPFPQLGLEN
jgi:hypothetical protein